MLVATWPIYSDASLERLWEPSVSTRCMETEISLTTSAGDLVILSGDVDTGDVYTYPMVVFWGMCESSHTTNSKWGV
jgi:hypothetical protein